MADREAKVRIGGDTTGLDRALGKAKGNLGKFAKDVKSDVGGALRGTFEGLGNVAGFAGVGSIALAARETKLWNDRLVALQQTTGLTRTQILAMNQQIQRTAVETGASQNDLLSGIEKYQEITGRVMEFAGALDQFAMIAKATNAPIDSIATTAAALNQNLGVTSGEFLKIFDILAKQGDVGAVEFKNMAGLVPTLTAQMQRFATKGVGGAAEMGAMLQVVRHGAGDASEAATQLGQLLSQIPHHWDKLEAHGVKVFTDKEKTKMRDVLDIVDDIAKKVPRAQLGKILGERQEALLAFDTIVRNRKEVADLMTTADKAGAVVQKFGVYSASSTAQFDKALASLHKTANDIMQGALPGIASAFEKIAAAIKWIGDHKDIAVAAFAAWKLAPAALKGLGGGGGGGGAGGLTGGLGAHGGAVPVYVTNLGAGGLTGGPGSVAGAAGKTADGLGKLDRAVDVASKVLFSLGVGWTLGSLIADAAGLNGPGKSDDVAAYRKYGQLADEYESRNVGRAIFGGDYDQESPTSKAFIAAAMGQKGSARRFHPGVGGIGEDETDEAYLRRSRAGIDARSKFEQTSAPINALIAELRRTQEALANQKMQATLDAVNDKIKIAVDRAKSRHSRRAP